MNNLRPKIAIAVVCQLSLLLTGCGSEKNISDLKITNGQDLIESSFPYVRQFYFESSGRGYTCSGTFVSDRLMITAAHCLPVDGSSLYLKKMGVSWSVGQQAIQTTTRTYLYYSGFKPSDPRAYLNDIAVVRWPTQTVSKWTSISSRQVLDNDQVSVMGFGYQKYNGTQAENPDLLRIGYNLAILIPEIGGVALAGHTCFATDYFGNCFKDYEWAASAPGDSGGPMLLGRGANGGLIAVDSAGAVGSLEGRQIKYSYYANVWAPHIRNFLRSNLPGVPLPLNY